MERRPQRGTNRGRSGMVARSTDGHKTNASLGADHLGGDWDGMTINNYAFQKNKHLEPSPFPTQRNIYKPSFQVLRAELFFFLLFFDFFKLLY